MVHQKSYLLYIFYLLLIWTFPFYSLLQPLPSTLCVPLCVPEHIGPNVGRVTLCIESSWSYSVLLYFDGFLSLFCGDLEALPLSSNSGRAPSHYSTSWVRQQSRTVRRLLATSLLSLRAHGFTFGHSTFHYQHSLLNRMSDQEEDNQIVIADGAMQGNGLETAGGSTVTGLSSADTVPVEPRDDGDHQDTVGTRCQRRSLSLRPTAYGMESCR